jgi:hypothetical protein
MIEGIVTEKSLNEISVIIKVEIMIKVDIMIKIINQMKTITQLKKMKTQYQKKALI